MNFAAQIGREYFVERCGNLAAPSWSAFTNFVCGTAGDLTVTDPRALISAPARFYRVRCP
jgi:hypothetical protein